MNAGFPEPKLFALGGWSLTLEQCDVALKHHGVAVVPGKHLIRQEELRVVYSRMLGKEYELEHCLTAPVYMGKGVCREYIVFPVTAGLIETPRVQYTAEGLEVDGLRQPDAATLAKLRKLLDVGPEVDISHFAARIAAVKLRVTEADCELILSNLSQALNVARKDVVFRLFHETDEMGAWERDLREMGYVMDEYRGAERSQAQRGGLPDSA